MEVSLNGGQTWQMARLREPNFPFAWVRWDVDWNPTPGEYSLQARATDNLGNTQPLTVPWNDKGLLYGVLAGLFGLGGGTIMVPMQMLLLKEEIKAAIQTSLVVIVITALVACIGHTLKGNILFIPGIVLGCGGLLGAQISTRTLPKHQILL